MQTSDQIEMESVKAPEDAQAFMDTAKQPLLYEVFIFN